MNLDQKVNILLVDDQPAKLISYEVILGELGENLVKANNAAEALEYLLKNDIAVLLVDVCMPDLDGFQFAAMVREHPRFEKTAIIFISAIQFSDADRLRGYEMGGVDYVPVPVVPAVLRAKVKIFVDLYRNTKQLEQLNRELENRVVVRTQELEASTARLKHSEQLRSLALAAGQMGSWHLDFNNKELLWDEGQYSIFGVQPSAFQPSLSNVEKLIHPEDWRTITHSLRRISKESQSQQIEFRVQRINGETRWCVGTVVGSVDDMGKVIRMTGVTLDVTDRKKAEEYQLLLAREVDHRARNMLAVVQSILSLTRASSIESYTQAVDGRIRALSRAHLLLSESRWQGADLKKLVEEEFAPYFAADEPRVVTNGEAVLLSPATAQTLALTLHELATNAVKYGGLSTALGSVNLTWEMQEGFLVLNWIERGGPKVLKPKTQGYGTKVITMSIERQLDGTVEFSWLPEGLRCMLSIPHGESKGGTPISITRKDMPEAKPSTIKLNKGATILLVEDEPLVAIMMEEALHELGFSILGPCSNTAEAIALLKRSEVSAAVLDINLNGQPSYELADILIAENTPFVFVTGFAHESIDPRFAGVPVLQKPIDMKMLLDAFVLSATSNPIFPEMINKGRTRTA